MTWSTGTGTDFKDLLDKVRADAVTHGWTVDSYVPGLGKAWGTLTLTGQPLDTETVTIDTKVYTFQTVLTNVDGNVLIGASASASIDNLIAAIVLGAGSGTDYAAAMTLHPTVTAAVDAGDTMLATAKTGGTAGNSIATTETLTNGSWGQTVLGFGVDPLEDPDVLYIHGPGPTGTENVHVNIRTGADIVTGEYWWEIRGALLYDSGLAFDSQPGVSPATYLLHWSSTIPYWLSVNDRRIALVTKSSTRYFSMYAGFMLPYATPVEYPYPLYIAASVGLTGRLYTDLGSETRSAYDPSQLAAKVRDPGGTWIEVYNHGNASANDDNLSQHAIGDFFMWPYHSGGSSTASVPFLRSLDIRTAAALSDSVPLFNLELIGDQFDMGPVGIIEGVNYIPGFGSSAEQTFTLDALAATEILTLTANAGNGETVTIGAKTYTFQTTLTDVDGNVLIGAAATDSIDNMVAAIGLRDGRGTLYAASTTIHPEVFAEPGAGDTMDVTAKVPGTGGNSLASTETMASGSWGAATLYGGTSGDTYIIFPCVFRVQKEHFFAMKQT